MKILFTLLSGLCCAAAIAHPVEMQNVATIDLPIHDFAGSQEVFVPEATLAAGGEIYTFVARMPYASKLAIGLIGDLGDATNLTVRIDGEVAENNGIMIRDLPVNDSRIWGKTEATRHFNAGFATGKLSAGRHLVSIENQSAALHPWRGLWLAIGTEADGFVGDVANGYSAPTAARLGDRYIATATQLFSDERFVREWTEEGQSARRLREGFSHNDVNHAGSASLALANGALLVIQVGHAGPTFDCYYWPDGDTTRAPHEYSMGADTSRYSYPHAVELPSGRVAVYFRGNNSGFEGDLRDLAVLWTFNPANGGNPQYDVLVAAAGWRAYLLDMKVAEVDGKTWLGFVWNPRSWASNYHERFCAAALNLTDSQLHAPNGTPLGGTPRGTDTKPRIRGPEWFTAASRGGCLLLDKPKEVKGLHCGDGDSAAIDLSAMPHRLRVFLPYWQGPTVVPGGGYQDDVTTRRLACDGGNVTDAPMPLSTGSPVSAFNTAALRTISPTHVEMVVGLRTRVLKSNIGSELLSPYYSGWGGGDKIVFAQLSNPFGESPRIEEKRVVDVEGAIGAPVIANIVEISGDPGRYVGMARYGGYSTHGRRIPVFLKARSGTITRKPGSLLAAAESDPDQEQLSIPPDS